MDNYNYMDNGHMGNYMDIWIWITLWMPIRITIWITIYIYVTEEEKRNDLLDSTGNCSMSGIQVIVHQGTNTVFYKGLRLEGKFVGKNVFNLSRVDLSPPEISLLSKGLEFVPSANKIDRAKLKRELEEYGRKLCLMWHL